MSRTTREECASTFSLKVASGEYGGGLKRFQSEFREQEGMSGNNRKRTQDFNRQSIPIPDKGLIEFLIGVGVDTKPFGRSLQASMEENCRSIVKRMREWNGWLD